DLQETIELRQLLPVGGFELIDEAVVTFLAVALEVFGPLAPEFALRRAPDERVAMPNEPKIGRVQFFCLDEDLLAHADLAEVVQEGGIANLFHLFPGERHVTIGPLPGAVHDLREPYRHPRHASTVAVRRRIPLL